MKIKMITYWNFTYSFNFNVYVFWFERQTMSKNMNRAPAIKKYIKTINLLNKKLKIVHQLKS